MSRRIYFFFLLFFLFAKLSSAQVLANDSLSRIINLKALTLISNYEQVIKFDTPTRFKQFVDLFHSEKVFIFNDVMPESRLDQKIEISEYIKLIKKYYSDTSFLEINIKPYDLSTISLEQDQYAMLSVDAKKFVSSRTKQNIYYTDTFNIRFDVIYDFNTNKAKIYGISSIEKREGYLQFKPMYRGLFNKKILINDTILVNDKIYEVNKFGYTLIKDVNISHEFLVVPFHKPVMFKMYRVPNQIPLIKNKLDPSDKNIVKINFWKWMVFFDFKYYMIPNGASPVKLQTDTFGINTLNNGSFSNFIMMNLVRRVSEKGYWSVKIGGGADVFNYQANLANNVNTYSSVDPDGDPYLRINRVYNIKETHQLVYTTMPLILEKGFCFGKNEVYVNLAYYLMLNFSAFYNQDADALYAGFYDYLFNLYISENGVYDFGTYKFNSRNIPLVVDNMITNYGFGLGYNRQMSRKVYFNIGLNYRKSNEYLFLEDNKNLSDDYYAINSLKNLNNKFTIEYMNVNFGLSIKL